NSSSGNSSNSNSNSNSSSNSNNHSSSNSGSIFINSSSGNSSNSNSNSNSSSSSIFINSSNSSCHKLLNAKRMLHADYNKHFCHTHTLPSPPLLLTPFADYTPSFVKITSTKATVPPRETTGMDVDLDVDVDGGDCDWAQLSSPKACQLQLA
ncbi:hypothetical protein AWZ03_011275, partial [Drosophila navojoa]